MLILGDGGQGEDRGLDGLLEVEDQSNGGGQKLAHAHLRNVGVVGLNAGDQVLQGGVEREAFEVDHQPIWCREQVCFEGEARGVVLNGHTGVVGCRPDPHRHHGHGLRRGAQAQQQGGTRGQ